jgi:N-acetylneuraminate synthase/sialic acid synthase
LSRGLTIDSVRISDESDCYVIAEIGHNHQGQVEIAKALITAAHECGVNAVKLQKRDNRRLYTRAMYEKPYENENSFGPTYGAHREALEFGRAEYLELQSFARELGLTLFATAFDFRSVDFLADIDMPAYKIASGDLNNIPLIKHVAHLEKPIFVSTGGGTMADVQRVYDVIMPINSQLCLLQCTASYPAEPQAMNLRVITTFRNAFPDVTVGLSDHQNGISMSVAAYLLGARVIEKHFTLNHASKGTDHAFSLEPIGMRKMVRDLRRTGQALGDGIKQPHPDEKSALLKMGKKLVAAHDLPAGHLLALEDIAIKSPNDGLPPYEIDRVIGRTIQRPLAEDENIRLEDLAPQDGH